MIEMRVTQKNRIRGWMIRVEEASDLRNDLLGFQHIYRLGESGTGIKRLAVGIHQRQTKIENQSGVGCHKLHTGSPDFFRATMDGQFHEGGFSAVPASRWRCRPGFASWLPSQICKSSLRRDTTLDVPYTWRRGVQE